MAQLGFFVPPPLAIAHHLIRLWALHQGPWFKSQPPAGGQGGSGRVGVTATALPTATARGTRRERAPNVHPHDAMRYDVA